MEEHAVKSSSSKLLSLGELKPHPIRKAITFFRKEIISSEIPPESTALHRKKVGGLPAYNQSRKAAGLSAYYSQSRKIGGLPAYSQNRKETISSETPPESTVLHRKASGLPSYGQSWKAGILKQESTVLHTTRAKKQVVSLPTAKVGK
ncbi:hypothetical protein PanWU01x14_092910 [Parasponia andersonii]|uniref:Uncharacterized protein n=1 Tax=Parasponia andersonii TaxID=3476 RepID=A0A2P5D6T8_PARAD|nr:hypothetical protein PanWU01x14_092910 [Parasponia andersonii]